ncbi:hypothetical protein Tco_1524271 [Tanacetum coccineum]
MVPRAVLTKSGLVSINIARQNISKTTILVNTARQVNTAHSKITVNAARPMSYLSKISHSTGNLQMDLQDQGVIDSGCSRHMIGNMSYLTDYEEIDGGYVAFGGNPKGGKITGKGSGPDWLFDIDALTRTMNYEPIAAETDMNNLDTTIQVSPNPTTRIHKDHPLDQVIGDLQSAIQTR